MKKEVRKIGNAAASITVLLFSVFAFGIICKLIKVLFMYGYNFL
jgi:hypothetical protein